MNAATGLSAPLLRETDLVPAVRVSEKTVECLRRFRILTGYEVFLYDVVPGAQAPDGIETPTALFLRNTESLYLLFTALHEGGHHEMRLKPTSAVRLRALYDQVDRREKLSYLDKQNEHARKIYGPGAKVVMDSATLRDEFIADMFGVYEFVGNGKVSPERILSEIGVSLETYDAFKALLDNEIFSGAALMEADLRDEAAGVAYDGSGYMGTQTMFAPPRIGTLDGIPVYRSVFPVGTAHKAQRQEIIRLIQDVWSKAPITLSVVENGEEKTLTAYFDPTMHYDGNGEISLDTNAAKLAGGTSNGSGPERRLSLRFTPDLPEIAQHLRTSTTKVAVPKAGACTYRCYALSLSDRQDIR